MPYDGKRFPDRSRARLAKRDAVIEKDKSRPPVAISMHLEPDAKIKQSRVYSDSFGNSMVEIPDAETGVIKPISTPQKTKLKVDTKKTENTSTNVKKEEPTPENNDVKTDSKE